MDDWGAPLRLKLYALLVGLGVLAVILLVGFLAISALTWVWLGAGLLVAFVWWGFGDWPGGEPFGAYIIILGMCLVLPPLITILVAYGVLEDRYEYLQQQNG